MMWRFIYFFKRFKARRLTKKIAVLQKIREHGTSSEKDLAKEKELYHHLADLYLLLERDKKTYYARDMRLAVYRASAVLDDTKAQFILGNLLLDEAKFRADLEAKGIFSSPSNFKEMERLYEESRAYFFAAEKLDHIQAKRMHGLFYINGWGVPVDKEHGFELVVESIKMENSWARVPQIFSEIGLNKPEFFSALSDKKPTFK